VKLTAFLHGVVPHEARESLGIWGVPFEVMPSREAALLAAAGAATRGALLLPPLDGEEATHAVARTLGAELVRDLAEAGLAPAVLIAPAGAAAALLGTAAALRVRTPSLRVVALCAAAAQDELPELPLHPAFGDAARGAVELRPVTRVEAAHARAELSRRHGLLAGHAGAFAVELARATDLPAGWCAVALLTSAGEREFSLDVPGQAEVQP
jgi:cysteine synthase